MNIAAEGAVATAEGRAMCHVARDKTLTSESKVEMLLITAPPPK